MSADDAIIAASAAQMFVEKIRVLILSDQILQSLVDLFLVLGWRAVRHGKSRVAFFEGATSLR